MKWLIIGALSVAVAAIIAVVVLIVVVSSMGSSKYSGHRTLTGGIGLTDVLEAFKNPFRKH